MADSLSHQLFSSRGTRTTRQRPSGSARGPRPEHCVRVYAARPVRERALDVLLQDYPAVPADQREPAEAAPQNHPLVAYYHLARLALADGGNWDFDPSRPQI